MNLSLRDKSYKIMALIILGILVVIAGFVLSRVNPSLKSVSDGLKIGGIVFVLFAVAFASIIQIGAGRIGVKTLFGKVEKDILPSGLHVVNPFYVIQMVDIQTQNYTMSGVHDEGNKTGDDAIKVLTADGLEVTIDLTVLYKVLPSEAPKLYEKTGLDYSDKIVRPMTRTKIRDNAVYYDAVSLYSKKRDEFQSRIFNDIDKEFKLRGLVLESLLVRNISLPASVKTTIESKINAEQDAQKMQFVLQKENQEAERKRVEANGIAEYQRILSSQLSDKMLQYESIKAQKELALSNNAKVLIMGNSRTPIILDAK